MLKSEKLYPVQKIVSDNGSKLIKTFYVSLEESIKMGYQHHREKREGKDALQKLLRAVRKDLGSAEYRKMLKENNITWEESNLDRTNTMRATLSAYKFLMEGNSINIEKTGSHISFKLLKKEPSKSIESQSKPVKKENEPTLLDLMEKLQIGFKEENGRIIIGDGKVIGKNRWGKPEITSGSICLEEICEAPESFKDAEGHFILIDSNYHDKDLIKTDLNGRFNLENKKWYVPFRNVIESLLVFKNVEMSPSVSAILKEVVKKIDIENTDFTKKSVGSGLRADTEIEISDFKNPEGIKNLELFPHQKKGVKFLLENKKAILGLAVGLGKTPSAIVAVRQLLNEKKIKRAIVIAPSSVKYNWKNEIENFSNMSAVVLESNKLRRKNVKEYWAECRKADVLIINYEMLRNSEVCKHLKRLAPNCVIADEAHKLKNQKAQQTKGFKTTWRMAEYKWFLSATPFPNGKPRETHTILSHLRPEKIGSWSTFGKRFVDWEASSFGAKPVALKDLDGLKEKMSDTVFMRNHNSPDVTTSLPSERHTTFKLEMTTEQNKMYKAIADDIGAELKRLEENGINASAPAIIAKLKRLEQVAIDPDMLREKFEDVNMNKLYPKEEWAVQTISEHLEEAENRGVVLFCDMKLPLQKIRKGLVNEGIEPNKVAFITGDIKPEERTAVQERFSKGEVKVVLCTNAGEEGINLQHGAHTLIHLDQPWRPAAVTQREGRILRTGQPSKFTNFYTPLISGTVEDKKRGTLAKKVVTIEVLLGEGSTGSVKNNIKADMDSSDDLTISDFINMI